MAALRVRVLCDGCEAAEASLWCVSERRSLCSTCAECVQGQLVDLRQPAAVLPLCHACRARPAARKSQIEALTLCSECRTKLLRTVRRSRNHQHENNNQQTRGTGSSSDDTVDGEGNTS